MSQVDIASLVLRVALGVTIALHGANKVRSAASLEGTAGWFASIGMRLPKLQARMAAGSEIIAGLLLTVGLFVPTAAGALAATMLVAIVVAHRKNGFFIFNEGQGWEYCAVLAAAAVALGSIGGGRVSLDHALDLTYTSLWGFWTALILGVGGAFLHLASSYRPGHS